MNYQIAYDKIIAVAQEQDRQKGQGTYFESHHIIPECLGGSNEKSNLVLLTAREHFVCHRLLSKIYPQIRGIQYAIIRMANYRRYGASSRAYQSIRKQYALSVSNDKDRSEAISKRLTGVKKSEEHKANWKRSREEGAGWICPEWKKEKQRETMKGENNPNFGKSHSPEAVSKIQEANRQKVTCPFCSHEGGIAIMKRWHFENCKMSPTFEGRKKYPTLECPHCGKIGGGSQMKHNHFDNCKQKPEEEIHGAIS